MDSARDSPTYRVRPQSKLAKKFGMGRHTMGIVLLMCVVFLWTASNFLASNILADDSFSHPFFITYINTSFFVVFLIHVITRRIFRMWSRGKLSQVKSLRSFFTYLDLHGMKEPPSYATEISPSLEEDGGEEEDIDDDDDDDEDYRANESEVQRRRLLNRYARDLEVAPSLAANTTGSPSSEKLGLGQTARLAAQFSMLWFLANYLAVACLQFTTVGSTTILTSTSGVWTLILGAIIRVERFTLRKALGVLASIIGVILISRVDLSSSSTPNDAITPPDSSPNDGSAVGGDPYSNKTPAEIALGDAMAALSALVYGVYTIVMKKQVGDESRVNMQIFFGLVGFFNVILMWPGFIILHVLDIERFSFPSENRIWTIILINSVSSLVSDICWAYAMLLTTPLVVTVGLSMTIPLSLVGQIILQGQYAGVLYWIGATIVFASFLIVNQESKEEEQQQQLQEEEDLIGSAVLSVTRERENDE